jgi:hypothetical protein
VATAAANRLNAQRNERVRIGFRNANLMNTIDKYTKETIQTRVA